ncbi:TRAP-type C4-dicarboxylate transport system, large permease component [Caenispirillum salinarum AK4]|uniref:TRAP transporter large permease protein n=1 Tax=Caenispirillum salinarum AK4 TaxID=1238182 RepID=K9HCA8_9PROT|nr:TRAP transporter large permease [Caenispirillum salinarum]EKV28143.1 TRAP-type C4-dicarboxylate transport system, large permease component [Caenispirillum salinarum AK4]
MTAGAALLLSFAALLFIGTPIAVALGFAGIVGIYLGLDVYALATVGTNTYNGIAKYPLIAIPLFILTGMIFERSGVAKALVTFASAIVGPRRGGLATVAVLVCLMMGGMSGSGPADAAAVAMVMIPSMMKAGYPKPFAASVIAAGASTAILIPPSVALIVYSILVPGADLRALFAGGIVPGLLAGLAIILPVLWLSRRHDFGAQEDPTRPNIWKAFLGAIPGLMAPVIILGGLRSGLFTPTEAAVVAVAYGIIVGMVIYRSIGLRDLYQVFVDSAVTSGIIMLIISLAGIFAWAGATLGTFDAAAEALLSVSDNQWVILAMIMVFLLIAGMVLDGISIYLIMLPLLMPIVTAFQWNVTWFGVVMAMNIAIGQFTPPVAVNLMVTTTVAGVPMESTFRWILWLVFSMGLALIAVLVWPELVLAIPRALGYRV